MKRRILGLGVKCPSIISRDCNGGIIYNLYCHEFTSPFINLYLEQDDFILLCNHLEAYINTNIIEDKELSSKFKFPVGYLLNSYGKINIYFMHYRTFEDAKNKWEKRKLKIDFNNLFILDDARPNVDKCILEKFALLPYKKILLSSNVDTIKYPFAYNLKCYENGYDGSLVSFKSKFSLYRYIEEVNWTKYF